MTSEFNSLANLADRLKRDYQSASSDELDEWFRENRIGIVTLADSWVYLRDQPDLPEDAESDRERVYQFFEEVDPIFLVCAAEPKAPPHSRVANVWKHFRSLTIEKKAIALDLYRQEGRIFAFLREVPTHGFAGAMTYMGESYLHICRNLLKDLERLHGRFRYSDPVVLRRILDSIGSEFDSISARFPEEVRRHGIAG